MPLSASARCQPPDLMRVNSRASRRSNCGTLSLHAAAHNLAQCASWRRLSVQRLRTLQEKKEAQAKAARRDIATLLERNKIETARIKVENSCVANTSSSSFAVALCPALLPILRVPLARRVSTRTFRCQARANELLNGWVAQYRALTRVCGWYGSHQRRYLFGIA